MSDKRSEHMRRLYKAPQFAPPGMRERFSADSKHFQRLANIAKRGCDVPPLFEASWKASKKRKISNREAARKPDTPWLGDPEDEANAHRPFRRACIAVDGLTNLVEADSYVGPDLSCELIERSQAHQTRTQLERLEGRAQVTCILQRSWAVSRLIKQNLRDN